MIAKIAVVTLLALATAGPAAGLDPSRSLSQSVHDAWEVDRGLPQNSILDIAQGPRGYLWMATFAGVARFDGVQFTVFDRSNTPQMNENSVWCLLVDEHDRVWAGTNGDGLLVFTPDGIESIGEASGLPSGFVTSIALDHSGRIWAGTPEGLAHQDGDRFVPVPEVDVAVRSLAVGIDDSVWAGTEGEGVYRLTAEGITRFGAAHGLPGEVVQALFVDPRDGVIWAGAPAPGLWRFSDQGWLNALPTNSELEDVRTLGRDRDGNLWIGTGHAGLFRLSATDLQQFSTDLGLTDQSVTSLFEDREGSLWVGTYRGGLNRLRDGKLRTLDTGQGLSNHQIRSVLAASDGSIWLGTVGGGANRILPDGRIEVLSTEHGLSNGLLWSLAEGRDGSIWMGSYGGGLNRHKNGTITVYSTANGLSHDLIRAVTEDRDGNLWIGTSGGGIDILRPDGSIDHLGTAEGLPSDSIYALLQDSLGAIWVGTYGGGVARIVEGGISVIGPEHGLSDDVAWSFSEDLDLPGTVWIGTNGGGVNRWGEGRISRFDVRNGLANDVVFGIVDDGDGTLWMSSQNGLFSVSKDSLLRYEDGRSDRIDCTTYDRSDGMKTWGCNGPSSPAGARDHRGRLWFPTVRGAVVVDPSDLVDNEVVPPVVIETFTVDGVEVDPTREAVLGPGVQRIEFGFTALSLLAPEKVRFRVRLENLEDHWVDVGDRRTAQYDRVKPGQYTFRVIACNNDGRWNETGDALKMTLRPFFYETRTFYALCVLAVFALGAGVVMVRMAGLKRRAQELSDEVRQRTEDLARANAELTRLANQDGLTGIANHRYLATFIETEWLRCRRHREALGLILFDVDFFKKYNDHYGHQMGDDCLKRIASVFDRAARRAGDVAGRYGGEEFLLVLSETGETGSLAVAERTRHEIEELGLPHAGSEGGLVTVSAGVAAMVPDGDTTSADLLRRADQALYRAKHLGRNRVELWTDESTPVDS